MRPGMSEFATASMEGTMCRRSGCTPTSLPDAPRSSSWRASEDSLVLNLSEVATSEHKATTQLRDFFDFQAV